MNQLSKEVLYDCIITYHLTTGQKIEETYRDDLPKEVWKSISEDFLDANKCLEISPQEKYDKILLPKANLSYITLTILLSPQDSS